MRHLWQILMAAVLAALIITAVNWVAARLNTPESYMVVQEIGVPDHTEGDDPVVIYDRDVRKPFTATWTVRIRRVALDRLSAPACRGGATNNYSPEKSVPPNITLSWYAGRTCVLGPGQYIMTTIWDVHDGPAIEQNSNLFTVSPADE